MFSYFKTESGLSRSTRTVPVTPDASDRPSRLGLRTLRRRGRSSRPQAKRSSNVRLTLATRGTWGVVSGFAGVPRKKKRKTPPRSTQRFGELYLSCPPHQESRRLPRVGIPISRNVLCKLARVITCIRQLPDGPDVGSVRSGSS